MKYTICGFNQNKMIEFGMDIIDAHLLRYFIDFKDTGKMIAEIFDNKPYYWIKYESVIEEIPTLKLKSKDSVYRRYKNMCKNNILVHKTRKDKRGTYSFYSVGENYKNLISDTGYGLKSERGTDINPDQKIPLLNKYPSTKNKGNERKLSFYELIDNYNLSSIDKIDDAIKIIEYYISVYEDVFKIKHINYTIEQWVNILEDIFKNSICDDTNIEVLKNAIDKHFSTKYKYKEIYYLHNFKDKVKDNRLYEADILCC